MPWSKNAERISASYGISAESTVDLLSNRTIRGLRDPLKQMGLLMPVRQRLVARWLPLLVALCAPAFGAMKILVGISRGRPVLFLVILCIASVALAIWVFGRRVERSRLGERALARFRRRGLSLQTASRAPGRLESDDLCLAVALFGLSAMAVGDLADLYITVIPPPAPDSSGWGDGGGSGCGGGGCGGGGCGGGGCGMQRMTPRLGTLGLGVGWRPELALLIERHASLGFIEILAEDFMHRNACFAPLEPLMQRGIAVAPHGISLSLGGAEAIDPRRLENLARLAERVRAPLVSEHLAFVRADGIEAGHLLPLPRTQQSLEIVVENIGTASRSLGVPLAIENIAAAQIAEQRNGRSDVSRRSPAADRRLVTPRYFESLRKRAQSSLGPADILRKSSAPADRLRAHRRGRRARRDLS